MKKKEVLVSLQMEGVPALSISDKCFDKLQEAKTDLNFIFCSTEEEFEKNLSKAEYILCWKFKESFYKKASKLKSIFTPAAGKDWIDPDPSGKVQVFHSTFHGKLMAESLLSSILLFNQQYIPTINSQRNSHWGRNSLPNRVLLGGQKIMIIGYGAIGQTCGDLLSKLGCNVTGVRRNIKSGSKVPANINCVTIDRLKEELPKADHVVLILPSNKTTDHLFTYKHLKLMKPTAVLHNIGRGNSIKESDLIKALDNGIIKGAALDVFEIEPLPETSKLWKNKNVLITPHSTCFYDEYGVLFAEEALKKL